ncbi:MULTISPECIES: NADPH-dependent 2,4-dienoyl-CoA reductase [Sphingobium]|uniref:NADPH-dependent 2,4-dienoyl-CoA reductase n=1 Tax=Sphingobium TaxID=165695 RepID=UPI00159C3FE4|nr:NADPH-dependent 2,4-dienoyl-CoA reductase [Sphingobium sp. 15-1]
MAVHFPNMLSPIKLGSLELANRVIMGSMHTGLEDSPSGRQGLAAFYAARARGGVGLIVAGGISPNPEGMMHSGRHTGFLNSRDHIPEHLAVTNAVHDARSRIALQLLHAGRYARHDAALAPSALKSRISPVVSREMSEEDIQRTLQDYANATLLGVEAGYDAVELMGAEGYLPNQFSALRSNQRSDRWGGTVENRQRFAIELVERVRKAVGPGYPIIYRISGLDLVEGGSEWREVIRLAKAVEAAGATALNVYVGWHEARVPTIATLVPRGAWISVAARLKEFVNIPVIGSNRINDPTVAEEVLASGAVDLISMARPFLADADFVNKAAAGQADQINTCIACNQACLDEALAGRHASCLVNPAACREGEILVRPQAVSQRVAIVGAGPAGLAAAVTAAQCGHRVTLFEADADVGGQFNYASAIPGKEEFSQTIRYYKKQIELLGVDLRLNTRASVDQIQSEAYDRILIAAGVIPRIPDIAGIGHGSVMTYAELIARKRLPGRRIAIIGAGGIGFDVAKFVTSRALDPGETKTSRFYEEWGVDISGESSGGLTQRRPSRTECEVWLLQRSTATLGMSLARTTGWIRRELMKERGVHMWSDVSYDRIDDQGLHVSVAGEQRIIPADTIVLCAGQESNLALAAELDRVKIGYEIIGGAKRAGEIDAVRAIYEGTVTFTGLVSPIHDSRAAARPR